MVTRRRFLEATGIVTMSHLAKPAAQEAPRTVPSGNRPNFLIFMPDQHQGQAVLPSHPAIMPNLRRFASQGVMFTRTFCPSPHCCPSRASFQTGLYPSEHGVFNNVLTDTAIHANPFPGVKFFSETLHYAGYQLAYSGKWHVARNIMPEDRGWTNLTPNTEKQGFQKFPLDYYLRPGAWEIARAELAQEGPRQRADVLRPGWGNLKMYGSFPPKGPHGYEGLQDYECVRLGAEGLQTLTKSGKPWCLMVSNSGAHDLYTAPQNFVDMYRGKSVELPASFRDTLEDKPRIYQRMRNEYWSQLSDEEVRECIAHYWAKMTMQDALFGLLLDALEKSGQADNTIVIYTSDHGDYAGAHGLWAKGIPSFQEAYNIPCVVRWPRGIVNPDRQVEAFVSTVDFAPTILDAAGLRPDSPLSGMSLLPWLRGETPSAWRNAIFAQCNGVELYYTQRIVMTDAYKYVYNGFDFDELYDLKNDPHELVNLAFPDLAPARTTNGQWGGNNIAWPQLSSPLAEVRRGLLKQMWRFAKEHQDIIFNPYLTVALAPYGPAIEL